MDSDKINFGRLGFNEYQMRDLRFILDLKTQQQIQDWAMSVSAVDVFYAASLVECAALEMLDQDVAAMPVYPEAMAVIRQVK
jgi:hypothetical protein